MTVIADIREFGTINTNADAEDIKPSQLVSLKNLRPIGKTKLIKMFGFGNKIADPVGAFSGTLVRNITTYVEEHLTSPDDYRYFVVVISSSKVTVIEWSGVIPEWKVLTLGSTYYHKTDINPILMHEKVIRFLPGNVGEASGHESKGIWYGYIDRNYFWNSAIKTITGFVVSQTTPSKDGFVISSKVVTLETTATGSHDGAGGVATLTDSTKSFKTNELVGLTVYNIPDKSHGVITANTATTVTAALVDGTQNDWDVAETYYIGILAGLSDDTYYYKITAMFDGIQETLLPTDYISIDTDGDNKGVLLQTVFDISSVFNERITSFNIYRSTNAISGYTKISSIGLLDTDPNLIYQAGALVGYGLYVPEKDWTVDDYSNKYAVINGIVYKIDSNVIDILKLTTSPNSIIVDGYEIWGGNWGIIDENVFNKLCTSEFEVDDWTGWTKSIDALDPERKADQKYQGSYSGKFSVSPGDTGWNKCNITVENGKKYYIAAALYHEELDSIKIEVSSDDSNWTTIISTPVHSQWESSGDVYTTTSTTLYIRIYIDNSGGGTFKRVYVDNLYIGIHQDHGDDDGYAGRDTVIGKDFNLDMDDGYKNWRVLVSNNTLGNNSNASILRKQIINNVKRAVKVDSDFIAEPVGNNQKAYICRNYLWQKNATNKYDLWFHDDGLLPTIAHPLENVKSIKVNGKFAKIIQGRLFQANVVLDPGDKNEVHNSAFTFSELNQIDVTPIDTDHIMFLPDREGGEITGLAEQFGSAVFFKKYAIFKLIITNPAIPSSWKRKESVFNAGNVAPQGVVECGNMIYFCSVDGIYRLVPNFESATDDTPLIKNRISEPINDHYLAIGDKTAIKGIYNQTTNEIKWFFTNEDVWAFNIITGNWREIGTSVDCDLVCFDEETNVLVFNKTDKKVYSSGEKESVAIQLKTKTFSISDIRKEIIRLCNITYESEAALTVNLRTENDNTIVKALTLVANSKIETKKLSLKYRAQKFNLELLEGSNSMDDVEIDRMKIEGN